MLKHAIYIDKSLTKAGALSTRFIFFTKSYILFYLTIMAE